MKLPNFSKDNKWYYQTLIYKNMKYLKTFESLNDIDTICQKYNIKNWISDKRGFQLSNFSRKKISRHIACVARVPLRRAFPHSYHSWIGSRAKIRCVFLQFARGKNAEKLVVTETFATEATRHRTRKLALDFTLTQN